MRRHVVCPGKDGNVNICDAAIHGLDGVIVSE
jgi:hypothetical protein